MGPRFYGGMKNNLWPKLAKYLVQFLAIADIRNDGFQLFQSAAFSQL